MSVQKITTVKAARKAPGKCGHCGDVLGVGDGYLWWDAGFRSTYRYVRCLKAECYPRPSERETSKASAILAAQENFADQLATLESVDDITSAVEDVASAVEEVRDEYQDALDQWEYGNEQLQEKVDHYDAQLDEIQGWEYTGNEEPEVCDKHDGMDPDDEAPLACPDCSELRDSWLELVREEAAEAVDAVETM